MPPDPIKAHRAKARTIDNLCRKSGVCIYRERVEHLFQRLEAMVKPLLAKPKRRRRSP